MAHLTLGVLGALQVTLTDGSTAKFPSDKTRALLAYLAVEADRPHRRDALIGLFWPNEPEQSARHNLRQALFGLRQTIRDSAAHPPYLHITRDEIQFNTASDFALDVASFNAHLAACASYTHSRLDACAICAPRLQQAVDLYRGKFLQEFFWKIAQSLKSGRWRGAKLYTNVRWKRSPTWQTITSNTAILARRVAVRCDSWNSIPGASKPIAR